MKLSAIVITGLLCAAGAMAAQAANMELPKFQEGVVTAVDNPEALFTSTDPKLHRNKQAALAIFKVLLEANHWDQADKYLTERYLQHNPMAASGRDNVVKFFTEVVKRKPSPIPAKLSMPIVAVMAEGDYVTVLTPRHYQDPKDPTKSYWTTWFDTWRFVDGKADEHWDSQTKSGDLKNAK
jgi:predicted SnoaL-like aldol condensation-catalyzing enzyme